MRADHMGDQARGKHLDADRPIVLVVGQALPRRHHRVEVATGKPAADSRNEPHRRLPRCCSRRNRRRATGDDDTFCVEGESLDEDDVGDSGRGTGHAGIDRFVLDVVSLEAAHERRRGVLDIECEHPHVAAPSQPLRDETRVADRDDVGIVGERGRQFGGGAIVASRAGELPDDLEGFRRRRHVRTKPPERSGERMAFDDAPRRNHESGRIEVQRTEGVGRLLDQSAGIDAVRPSDVPQVLDRMHATNVPSAGRRSWGEPERIPYPRAVADTELTLPSDLVLTPLVRGGAGTGRPLMEWLTTFHLASVVLDPYTNESSWILRTATRVLEEFRDCDVRINLLVTAPPDEAAQFLGPLADRFLVFCDPERAVVRAMELNELPAFVLTRVDGVVDARAEGWDPEAWERVADAIAALTKWLSIELPLPGDPVPFRGSPALG